MRGKFFERLDHPLQVDTTPANHVVDLWIGASFHNHREFAHLLLRQKPADLASIETALGQVPKLKAVIIIPKNNAC